MKKLLYWPFLWQPWSALRSRLIRRAAEEAAVQMLFLGTNAVVLKASLRI